jgi:D-threo-aldose 1-dehydrogenase
MSTIGTRQVGRTGLYVSELGMGGAPLGELFERVNNAQAEAVFAAAWEAGIRYYDTAPFYGYGKSERRFGHFLEAQERQTFAISTKVGRVFRAARNLATFDGGLWVNPSPFDFYYDYSYDGIMRSYEDSLQRLGLNSVDLLMIHDLDHLFHETDARVAAHMAQLYTSGWRALEELRSSGQVKGVGSGINRREMIPLMLDTVPLDCFVVAMPYTLLDQGVLDAELPRCQEAGVGVIIGSVFASGILASGPVEGAKYAYEPASPEILDKTRRIEAVCQRHSVPLATAAMQFPLGHPSVAAIIPGAIKPEHIQSNIALFRQQVPLDLWAELKHEGLLREDAPTPGD